ncbi:putative carbohydrate sulfotransferase 10-like 6, partial [Homarus americanus]
VGRDLGEYGRSSLSLISLQESQMKINGCLSVIPTFSEFVYYLLKTPLDSYDPHWAPYWKHCVPCVMNYHEVLEDNSHQGRGDTSRLHRYYSTLDIHTLEAFYRKYEIDVLLLDYDIQPLLVTLYPGKFLVKG